MQVTPLTHQVVFSKQLDFDQTTPGLRWCSTTTTILPIKDEGTVAYILDCFRQTEKRVSEFHVSQRNTARESLVVSSDVNEVSTRY